MSEGRGGTIADDAYVSALVRKWEQFLEGVPARTKQERHTRGVLAMLYENEMTHLRHMTEETRAINTGSFTKFIFPLLRRVFPNLISNDLVSVQPMTAPIGAVFFLDYLYATSKGATQAGNVFPEQFDKDYTSENINGEILATGNGADFGGVGTPLSSGLAFSPVRPLSTTSGYRVVIREIHATTGATVQEAIDNGAGGFTGNVTAGTINYSNGQVSGFLFTAAPANNNKIQAFYSYDGELNPKIPSVKLDVKKAPIEAVARRMKAMWSSEAAEDLRAFHGVEAETELVSVTSQEMAMEIDREIIGDLFAASTGTTGTWDRVPPAGVAEHDHLRAMLTPISQVASAIHRKTLRAPANFIVTSPDVSALLQQLTTHTDFRPAFVSGDPNAAPMDLPRTLATHGQFGIYKVGTLQNKLVVYEDPFFTRDMMLIGLKGQSYLDAGYVWAPYIPLQVTPTFLDPNDMSFRKGLRTRYGKKLVRNSYYGQLRVLNLLRGAPAPSSRAPSGCGCFAFVPGPRPDVQALGAVLVWPHDPSGGRAEGAGAGGGAYAGGAPGCARGSR